MNMELLVACLRVFLTERYSITHAEATKAVEDFISSYYYHEED